MSEDGVLFAGVLAERVRQEAMTCLDAGATTAGACLFAFADRADQFAGTSSDLVLMARGFADRYATLLWEDEAGQFQSVPATMEVCLEEAVRELIAVQEVATW